MQLFSFESKISVNGCLIAEELKISGGEESAKKIFKEVLWLVSKLLGDAHTAIRYC
jgi:hypothetical protein